jgi:hypothetical protein
VASGSKLKEVSPAWVFLLLVALALAHKLFSPPVKRFFAKPAMVPALTTPLGVSLGGGLFILAFVGLMALVLIIDPTSPTGRVTTTTLSTRSGKLAVMCLWVAILPTAKTSITLKLFGVDVQRAVWYHRAAVVALMASGLLHLLANWFLLPQVFFSAEEYGSSKVKPLFGLAKAALFSGDPILVSRTFSSSQPFKPADCVMKERL